MINIQKSTQNKHITQWFLKKQMASWSPLRSINRNLPAPQTPHPTWALLITTISLYPKKSILMNFIEITFLLFFTVRPCKHAFIHTPVFIIFELFIIGTIKCMYLHLAPFAQHCKLHLCFPCCCSSCSLLYEIPLCEYVRTSPFHCQWSFELILIFGYFELGCHEYSCAFLFTAHVSVRYTPRIKVFNYRARIRSTLANSLTLSTKVDTPAYTSVCDIPAVSHSGQHLVWLSLNFRQCGGCLRSSIVLICIFIITNVVEYVFIFLLAIWISSFAKCLFRSHLIDLYVAHYILWQVSPLPVVWKYPFLLIRSFDTHKSLLLTLSKLFSLLYG